MLKDGIVFKDGGNRIVFNQYSFCELIKHLLSHYAKPVSNAIEAVLLSHEYPYYWAMKLYYGNMYWEKGIPAQPSDMKAYFELENSIKDNYKLNDPFIF